MLAFGRLRFSLDLAWAAASRARATRSDCSGHRYSPTRRMRDDQSTKFRRSAQRLFSLALRKEADSSACLSGGGGEAARNRPLGSRCDAAPGRNAAELAWYKTRPGQPEAPLNRRLVGLNWKFSWMAFDGGLPQRLVSRSKSEHGLGPDCGVKRRVRSEIARIDDAWPTHESALWLAELLAPRLRCLVSILRRFVQSFERVRLRGTTSGARRGGNRIAGFLQNALILPAEGPGRSANDA